MTNDDGSVTLKIANRPITRMRIHGFERDADGELWHVIRERDGDGPWVEIQRTSARGMQF